MLAIAGLVAFIIAAILELTKDHLNWVIWLIIIGGILACAHMIWGWYGARGTRPAGTGPAL
jgi:hypothetical protein